MHWCLVLSFGTALLRFQEKEVIAMKWDIICFDLDNTLYNYEKTFQYAMEHCFQLVKEQFNYNVNSRSWFKVFKTFCDLYWQDYANNKLTKKQYRRLRYIDTMEEFNIKSSEKEADFLQENFFKEVAEFVVPFEGMSHLIRKLSETQSEIGVISNGSYLLQYRKLEELHLLHFFQEKNLFISEQVKLAKPNSGIFEYAQAKLGSEYARCVYIGDSWELDIMSSIKAGWDAIYFNTTNKKPGAYPENVYICTTVNELDSYLFT